MRYLLILSAIALAALTGVQFVGEPASGRGFEGMRVVLLTGGRPGEAFHKAVRDGASQAERDLGCEVEVACTRWINGEEGAIFQQVMAGVPDGIGIMGNPSNSALVPLIQDALDEGIVVTSYYERLSELQTTYRGQGFSFAGPDFRQAAVDLLRAAAKKHDLKSGGRVLVIADVARHGEDGILAGARQGAAELGLGVEEFLINLEQTEPFRAMLRDYLIGARAAQALPSVIFSIDGQLGDCIFALEQAEIPPETLPLIGLGVDHESYTLHFRNSPHLSLLIGQGLSTQAYMAVLQACLGKRYGSSGTTITTPHRIIGPDSVTDSPEAPQVHFTQQY